MSPSAAWILPSFLLLLVGCAGTRNYTDPSGPITSFTVERTAGAPRKSALRVVTFNIEHAIELEAAARLLQKHPRLQDVDLLLLQEMDGQGVRKLAEALEMNWAFAPASVSRKTNRDFGNAVLSPYPILGVEKIQLPHSALFGGTRRIALAATLDVNGTRVRAYSVHLSLPIQVSPSGRREQLETVLADACGHPGPAVIGGDFNSGGIGTVLEEGGFSWPTRGLGATTRIFGVDHIFLRGFDLAAKPPAGVVRDGEDVSDHDPVWVSARLADPRRRALAPWDWARRERTARIDDFAYLEPTLARGARPGREGLGELRRRGFRTVIDLTSGDSERELAEEQGLEYHSIPLTAFLWSSPPQPEQVDEFLRLVGDETKRPLFFHCAQGKDRTGMMAALYRIEAHGWTNGEAILEMQSFGYHDYFDDLIQYVRNYVPTRVTSP